MLPEIAFNDLSTAEAEYYTNLTTWSSLVSFTEANTYAPWANGIPAAYIHTSLDNALPLAYQTPMAAILSASENITEYTLESSHCPWISMPEETLAVWEDIVAIALSS